MRHKWLFLKLDEQFFILKVVKIFKYLLNIYFKPKNKTMDAMMAEELYSKLYNGEKKTVHGTTISQEKPLDLSYNSCVDKNTLFNKRERRNAIYDNTNKFD